MLDLEPLRELCAWMRTEKVLHARVGELELRLDPAPPQAVKAPSLPAEESPHDEERRYLEELLFSSGSDPSALDHLLRKRAA